MIWLLIIGSIVLIIIEACHKKQDGKQAKSISKIGGTMIKVGISILVGFIYYFFNFMYRELIYGKNIFFVLNINNGIQMIFTGKRLNKE